MASASLDRTITKLNRGATKHAKIERVGRFPFGDQLHFERFRLGNGLELIVLPDASAPILSYHTWFQVGSRHERLEKTGLSHLLEHLMFLGTKRAPEGTFDRALEEAGGENNAATWTDWTYYYENVPASELDLVVRLESDRIANLAVSEERFLSERDVVVSERRDRVEDDVEGAASELLYATAFGRKHGYGWPTIGWMRDIRGLSRKDALAHYRARYAPNGASVIIAGKLDVAEVLEKVQRAYGRLRPARLTRTSPPPVTKQTRERKKTLRFATPTQKLLLGWHAPPFAHPDHAVLVVAEQLLAGGRSARLYERLVRGDELASEVRMSLAPFVHATLADLWASAREGISATRLLAAVDQEIARLAVEGPSEEELTKVKNRLELGFLGALETVPGKAEQLGFSFVVTGDPAHTFQRLAEYRAVTAADVVRVVRDVFRTERRTRITVAREARA